MPEPRPRTPSFRLDGRRALVTGAGRGIGRAAAFALADAGAAVTLAARSAEEIEAAAEAIRAEGGEAEALRLDVTDLAAVSEAFAARPAFHAVVNSAGGARHAPLMEVTPEDYDAVMALNVRAAFFVAQAAARRMIEERTTGAILQVSSQMGHVGGPERSVYCASKHAVEGMTKAMALELAPHGIRVNTLCPTFVETPMTAPMLARAETREWVERSIPLGRPGQVEDLMGAVVWLCSDAAALVTGAPILVDGGWTAR
ncbi:MAG TPA: SDR family NAD(P)-dependent oxidoreductase [Paracoccaceae bacterium]|nr:SDR family NAD(P)-dependent oxidoreductase [Paracoccaceae bacterium]